MGACALAVVNGEAVTTADVAIETAGHTARLIFGAASTKLVCVTIAAFEPAALLLAVRPLDLVLDDHWGEERRARWIGVIVTT